MSKLRDTPADVSRADLIRVGLDPRLAEVVGFIHDAERRKHEEKPNHAGQDAEHGGSHETPSGLPAVYQGPLAPIEFLISTQISYRRNRSQLLRSDTLAKASPVWDNRPSQLPELIPLADEGRLKRLYDLFAPGRRVTRTPDVNAVINQLVKARPLKSIPRKSYKTGRHIQIVADRSARLAPIWRDQKLAMLAAPDNSHFWIFEEAAARFRKVGEQNYSSPHPEDGPIVVLGDLGAFGGAQTQAFWHRIGEEFTLADESTCAVLPCAIDDVPPQLLDLWTVHPWEQSAGTSHLEKRESDLEHLLMLSSYASRLEPGLLRALRRQLSTAEAVTELLLYKHPAVASPSAEAATLDPQKIGPYRRKFEQFAREYPEQARKAWAILRQWRAPIGDEFMFEELMSLPPDIREWLPEEKEDAEHAEAFWCSMRDAATAGQLSDRAAVWLRSAARRRIGDPSGLFSFAPANEALQLAAKRQKEGPLADQELIISLNGNQLCLGSAKGSLLGMLQTRDGEVIVEPAITSFQDRLRDGSEGPEMIIVPPGSFMMGSPSTEERRWDDEGPQQRITFDEPFALARYPVTFEDYDAFCDATGREKPNDKGWGRGRKPVINVNWNDAQAYCDWLSAETGEPYHLPSEAAWEYACRAGTQSRYHWGDEWSSDKANGDRSQDRTTDVGSYDPNGWGFQDMHGNVFEWCADIWHGSLEGTAPYGLARLASTQASESSCVLRGGSWYASASRCRSACRGRNAPGNRFDNIGFRPARGQATGAQAGGNAERSGAGGGKAGVAEPPAGRSPRSPSGRRPGGESQPLKQVRVLPGREAMLEMRDLPDAPFVIRTDRAELVIQRTTLSDLKWASGMGRDRFGLWAEFALDDLRPRLRYCPPGRFTMGSPDDEPGRDDDEGPLTEVTFETGFWMFETPVTQDLYAAVMLDVKDADPEPSRFKSPRRPVDSVSWKDAQGFIKAINNRLPSLDLHLPSESAWEYACRAGTQTASYAGPIAILGANNAPVLDDIAWYGGNSGKDFDLENGHDSSGWNNKQYPHKMAGTREVGLKRPNPWGMQDMLGNILEWCDDVWKVDHERAAADGAARQVSQQASQAVRVLRGGSWDDVAKYCRSAYRSRSAPDSRSACFGFRPARGQQGAQAGGNTERSLPGGGKAGVAEPPAGRSPGSSRLRRDDSISSHPPEEDA